MSYAIVWFKRDLRWHDHAALAHAAKNGPVRCIYVIEPSLWAQSDVALQHFEFIHESIQALNTHFRSLGGEIEIHVGEVPEVLSKLWQEHPFEKIYSHEETGNGLTFARDIEVGQWCRQHQVNWQEFTEAAFLRH